MNKMILLTPIFFLAILLSGQTASGYTIDDFVPDRLGARAFEIYGVDVSRTPTDLTFSLYTNYPQGGYTTSGWATFAGDLAIDANNDGTYEYGFALTSHDTFSAGKLYGNTSWKISNDYEPSPGHTYNKGKIVTIQAGTLIDIPTSLVWNSLTGDPDYRIDITFDPNSLGGLNGEFGLYWASATCANDYVEGTTASVPEPSIVLLLGSGLLSLAAFRMKFKK